MTTATAIEVTKTSRQIRIRTDLTIKLAAIARYQNTTAPDILDPMIRGPIDRQFDALPAEFRQQVAGELADA